MKRLTSSLLLAGLFSVGGWSHAALADEGLTGQVGAGLGYQPYDPSGSRYEVAPLPYVDLDWGDVSLSGDDGLTWDAFKSHGFSIGPFANYVPGRVSNGSLRGLRDVPDMGVVGGFVEYAPADFWRLFAELGSAVGGGGGQGGLLGRLGGELGYPLGMGIIGRSNFTAHYADERQAQTFFGVSAQEAQDSGIRQYHAGGGFQNLTLTQSFAIPLGGNWSLMTSASWIHLVGSAADSSIVKQKGDSDQGQIQTAISYKF
ncbi:MipA/OmpV family protein [Pseudomonas gingeri]|uniref:MipA/OmpV family protein n=1 Tax=Pseudomonas gingeri TaxID=117681 RepID=UPI0015A06EA9|nr:MipA/OmpV family protein [Pseudomonas gingeri]NWA27038.1 MipA/OmpV family protein [Pseudomonas gingeri]NWD70875.1 MipA/OmpV family protein [Pseudomonas gingeri]NWD72980.1 MipA/OmpV family protein [Pseudomonas gingeri]